MCTNCRDRFGLPLFSGQYCGVCWTLQRLSRLVLTRHPREEAHTLLKLLERCLDKVETFVEQYEANQALGAQAQSALRLAGSAGPVPEAGPETVVAGLSPAPKKSTKLEEEETDESWGLEEEDEEEERETGSKDRTLRDLTPLVEREVDKTLVKAGVKDHKTEEGKKEKRRKKDHRGKDKKAEEPRKRKALSSESSGEKKEKKLRERSHHEEARGSRDGGERRPREPSKSPPGYHRDRPAPGKGSRHWRGGPKRDKGQNHRHRGQVFREKYGYDRGRGKGRGAGHSARRW